MCEVVPREYAPMVLSKDEYGRTTSSYEKDYGQIVCQEVEELEAVNAEAANAVPEELMEKQ